MCVLSYYLHDDDGDGDGTNSSASHCILLETTFCEKIVCDRTKKRKRGWTVLKKVMSSALMILFIKTKKGKEGSGKYYL